MFIEQIIIGPLAMIWNLNIYLFVYSKLLYKSVWCIMEKQYPVFGRLNTI